MASVTKIREGDLLENIEDGFIVESSQWNEVMTTIKTAINTNADILRDSDSGSASEYYVVASDYDTASKLGTNLYFPEQDATIHNKGPEGSRADSVIVTNNGSHYQIQINYDHGYGHGLKSIRMFELDVANAGINIPNTTLFKSEVYNKVTVQQRVTSSKIFVRTRSTNSIIIVIQGVAL